MKKAVLIVLSIFLSLSNSLSVQAGETAIEKTTVTITADASTVYETASAEAKSLGTVWKDATYNVIAYDDVFWKIQFKSFIDDIIYDGYIRRVHTTTPAAVVPIQAVGEIKVNGSFRFRRNQDATIFVVGEPDTEYEIAVYYSSGASTTQGLHAKRSDSNGNVSWTWRVGVSIIPGTYSAVVAGGGVSRTIYFEIEPE